MRTADKYLELAQILRTRANSQDESAVDRWQKLQLAEQLEWLAQSENEGDRAATPGADAVPVDSVVELDTHRRKRASG